MDIRVADDPDALAETASAWIARTLRESDGPVTLGLAGGGTPLPTYSRLREEDVPWERVDAWIGDERWVPPDHSDSNTGMIREALLDHVPARLHAPSWGRGEPHEAAAGYEETLRSILIDTAQGPTPDMVLLGVGEDGHTASLFPGSEALAERDRLYVANWVAVQKSWRLTATLPLLWAARRLVFLVSGAAKALIVAELIDGSHPHPARRVADGAAEVTWFLDAAAAGNLDL